MQAVGVEPPARAPCELARHEDVRGLGLHVRVPGTERCRVRLRQRGEVHSLTEAVYAARDDDDAWRVVRGRRAQQRGHEEFGEEERADVVRGDLALDPVLGERERADGRGGVVDEDLCSASRKAQFESGWEEAHMQRLRVRVHRRGGGAHAGERGEVKLKAADVRAGRVRFDPFFRELQPARNTISRPTNSHSGGPTHRSSLYPVITTRFAYFAMTRAVSNPIPLRDVPVIRTARIRI